MHTYVTFDMHACILYAFMSLLAMKVNVLLLIFHYFNM